MIPSGLPNNMPTTSDITSPRQDNTESTNDHVGRLDPNSGKISFFTMPGPSNQLMEIASDEHGMIWITAFNSGLLVSLDPQTDTFTPYYAPFSDSGAGGIYGLTISP